MFVKINDLKAQAAIEYVVVITAVLFALLVLQKYIARGVMGRMKASVDAFGHGRQYDPNSSQACAYDHTTSRWYDTQCYFSSDCDVACFSIYGDPTACATCIGGCGC